MCNLLRWLLQAASRATSCIDLYTMAFTSCVMCNLLHWLIYSGFYKLRHVHPLALNYVQWLLQTVSSATSSTDFYKLRHVQPLALTYIQWQRASDKQKKHLRQSPERSNVEQARQPAVKLDANTTILSGWLIFGAHGCWICLLSGAVVAGGAEL